MRILVIEDDASVLDYISKGLRESGFAVDQAADGKDGLYRASAEKYDALVVDRMLPGVDGLTIIRTLRGADNNTPARWSRVPCCWRTCGTTTSIRRPT